MTRQLPHYLILLGGCILALIIWALIAPDTIDLHLHDTYFLLGTSFLAACGVILLTVETLFYYLTRSFRQSNVLRNIHLYTTALALAGIFFLFTYGGIPEDTRSFTSETSSSGFLDQGVAVLGLTVALALLTGHLAFIVNITTGFIRGKKAPL